MIIPFTKINKEGKETQFFTHSNYLAQDKIEQINQGVQTRNAACNYLGLAGAIATYFVQFFLFRLLKCQLFEK